MLYANTGIDKGKLWQFSYSFTTLILLNYSPYFTYNTDYVKVTTIHVLVTKLH